MPNLVVDRASRSWNVITDGLRQSPVLRNDRRLLGQNHRPLHNGRERRYMVRSEQEHVSHMVGAVSVLDLSPVSAQIYRSLGSGPNDIDERVEGPRRDLTELLTVYRH